MFHKNNKIGSPKMYLQCFCLCLLLNVCIISSSTFDESKQLIDDKIARNSPMLRPRLNQSDAVDVDLTFYLQMIQSFDEVESQLTVMMVFNMAWVDEIMKWNPAEYGGVTRIKMDIASVWTPVIVLANSVSGIDKIGYSSTWIEIPYDYKGRAKYNPTELLTSICKADVTFYPWDRNECRLYFSTYATFGNEVRIKTVDDTVRRIYFSPNGAWDLSYTKIENNPSIGAIIVYLGLDRKPNFIVVNVILPIHIIAIMSIIVFWIPVDSGERISYSITLVLAMAVFLSIVSENLPKTSNSMSYFSYYVVCLLVINMFVATVNIYSIRIYHCDSVVNPGRFWQYVTCWLNCRARKHHNKAFLRQGSSDNIGDKMEKSKYNLSLTNKQQGRLTTDDVHGTNKANVYKVPLFSNHTEETKELHDCSTSQRTSNACNVESLEENSMLGENVTWKNVSASVDKISFVLFLSCIIVSTILFFVVITAPSRKTVKN